MARPRRDASRRRRWMHRSERWSTGIEAAALGMFDFRKAEGPPAGRDSPLHPIFGIGLWLLNRVTLPQASIHG